MSEESTKGLPVWLPPALLTLAVTVTGLGSAQLWRDELATWSAATRSPGELARLAGTIDAATGPYYLLMHGWVAVFGDSTVALRVPAVLAMTVAAGLLAVLGERLVDRRTGLFAGLLFAVLPGTSRYGQEARPYALATALAVLATLLLVTALRRPGWARWAGYAAAVAALGLTHLIALTLLAAHALVVLITWWRGPAAAGIAAPVAGPAPDCMPAPVAGPAPGGEPVPVGRRPGVIGGPGGRDRRLWRWVVALVPAALVVTPLLLRARTQRSRQLSWVAPARLDDLSALPGGVAQSSVVGGLVVGVAALGAARLGRRALLPVSALLLPVALLFAAGAVVPLWVPRYLVFVVPFACLLAGAALAGVSAPAALAVVVVTGLLGLPDQTALRRTHEWPRSAPVDYAGAARVIADGQRPGDAVVYSPRDSWLFLDLGIGYHLDDPPRDVLVTEDEVRRGDLWAAECAQPAQCLDGTSRVWLVVAGRRAEPLAGIQGPKGDALRADFTVAQVWQRPGLTVALLTRRTAS
ncbi:glycosyltransferase family 39 protein [Micromonospora profundi]|uniref:Glycosyltransferase family 39 protein n=1 Tax=Micromonospora profundi TaxID=1420889 RepID=A0AAJ6L6C4_9ACTN|nr:glycosyltransferase family 39 protein [Micromonospora profundi]WLS48706.1 glycosyltransferase family 39 protein [Micromonospora profundi]